MLLLLITYPTHLLFFLLNNRVAQSWFPQQQRSNKTYRNSQLRGGTGGDHNTIFGIALGDSNSSNKGPSSSLRNNSNNSNNKIIEGKTSTLSAMSEANNNNDDEKNENENENNNNDDEKNENEN